MRFAKLLLPTLALLILAPRALATWSLVVMDMRTGEIGVASATCIPTQNLKKYVPLIIVGEGAAAAQSFIDTSAVNRNRIWAALLNGDDPQTILDQLAGADSGHQTRQYGLVNRFGPPLTFTGNQAGQAHFGVAGQVGHYQYAIQGNVLTDASVILAAEQAFRNSPGDMAERLMQGMQAARALGGDGRCSCSNSAPTSCGAPPVSFTHSAYIGFLIVARPGDTDGICHSSVGCASGEYYLDLNFRGSASTEDPVEALQNLYDPWRAGLHGVPDHMLSRVHASATRLRADDTFLSHVRVELVDAFGQDLTQPVQFLEVTQSHGPPIANVINLIDHLDGTYSFDLEATPTAGDGEFLITAVTNSGDRIQISPGLTISSSLPGDLHLAQDRFSALNGPALAISVHRPTADAGRLYRVLGSLSGTTPGTMLGGTTVPLNQDGLFQYTMSWPGGAPFQDNLGTLDTQGFASASLDLPPGRLNAFIGQTISFAAVVRTPQGLVATESRSVLIEP
ncbi:MAG: DUF1028 domain-containing protein [Planctomycetota bacterium]|nr:DUF1028 domain-containing protein [Planctomycetota bacterium]